MLPRINIFTYVKYLWAEQDFTWAICPKRHTELCERNACNQMLVIILLLHAWPLRVDTTKSSPFLLSHSVMVMVSLQTVIHLHVLYKHCLSYSSKHWNHKSVEIEGSIWLSKQFYSGKKMYYYLSSVSIYFNARFNRICESCVTVLRKPGSQPWESNYTDVGQ